MARVIAWLLGPGLLYLRGGILLLAGIMISILSSMDIKSWWFWIILIILLGAGWHFRATILRVFNGIWRIVLIVGLLLLGVTLYNRVSTDLWPAATATARSFSLWSPSSWWGSAKATVAPTAGQAAPNVDMTTPTLPTSQVVATTPVAPETQQAAPATVAQGCPQGYVCVPEQTVPQATLPTTSSSQSVPPSPQKGGKSLRELMRETSSEEALAMSRRFSGDEK
ncbi:MAG: hypothetical protein A2735_02760 [Candidatus Yanofskybacteria bacterium RIFCSPHIGHO2_01_FULL_41_21]|uniref:Uncharacterized protein n=1 Tax=Candidatus Yanofskybacteria bacterium RIFCSPHIGHO2_01_FULL_41_21 TaxID=1802660 RepID=A0A1F8EAM2_9BACT|nr:MAG: hypothetical protein A2735_02760 [Candidatus Yanofskybacteria bacterium RIFCSPHIGHO2_01_FULL_41_21]